MRKWRKRKKKGGLPKDKRDIRRDLRRRAEKRDIDRRE